MRHHTLHEVAKFGAGLVLGDFLALWWVSAYNLLPFNFIGINITQGTVPGAMVFDAALFIILIHYGWGIGKMPVVREKAYLKVVGAVFGIVGIIHLARVLTEGNLTVWSWSAPVWLSWFGVVITLYLSYMSFRLVGRVGK